MYYMNCFETDKIVRFLYTNMSKRLKISIIEIPVAKAKFSTTASHRNNVQINVTLMVKGN